MGSRAPPPAGGVCGHSRVLQQELQQLCPSTEYTDSCSPKVQLLPQQVPSRGLVQVFLMRKMQDC